MVLVAGKYFEWDIELASVIFSHISSFHIEMAAVLELVCLKVNRQVKSRFVVRFSPTSSKVLELERAD